MPPAIVVENLSKLYRIRHEADGRPVYRTLREELTRLARIPWNWLTRKAQPRVEDFWALKNVAFEVQPGEVVGVIGRNGAGKSTLLKILSRITPPTTGRVRMRGRVGSLLEVGTGFHAELTGRENIFLSGSIMGMARRDILRQFDEIVAFAEVDQFLDTPVKRYSSGMYMRLAFAVAAHLEPEILIVDEVLAVGDAEFQKRCLGKIGDVARGGRTVMFVSHNMPAIQRMCSSCLLLRAGQVVSAGNVDNCVQAYLASGAQDATQGDGIADLVRAELHTAGTGRARIECMELIANDGTPTGTFMMGEPMRVRMTIRSQTAFAGLVVSFSFYSADGVELHGSSAHDGGIDSHLSAGVNVFECIVDPMILVPGNYAIRATVFSSTEILDLIDEAMRFRVDTARHPSSATPRDHFVGHVYLGYAWKRLPGEPRGDDHEKPNSADAQRFSKGRWTQDQSDGTASGI